MAPDVEMRLSFPKQKPQSPPPPLDAHTKDRPSLRSASHQPTSHVGRSGAPLRMPSPNNNYYHNRSNSSRNDNRDSAASVNDDGINNNNNGGNKIASKPLLLPLNPKRNLMARNGDGEKRSVHDHLPELNDATTTAMRNTTKVLDLGCGH